jgi:hypothetical protein
MVLSARLFLIIRCNLRARGHGFRSPVWKLADHHLELSFPPSVSLWLLYYFFYLLPSLYVSPYLEGHLIPYSSWNFFVPRLSASVVS